jgi:hypothetical protein
MTTKAIEAGARALIQRRKAIFDDELDYPTFEEQSAIVIEAAIASGELVPASDVAAERERCIDAIPCTAENPNEDAYQRGRFDGVMEYQRAIRALEPASGEYVLVPRHADWQMMVAARDCDWPYRDIYGDMSDMDKDSAAGDIWAAMITAATSNGSGK